MTHPSIDFQGDWPEPLRADVENLIAQYADEPGGDLPSNSASPEERAMEHATRSAPGRGVRWIAQHNPSPTGPLYAVGRTSRNGCAPLGPVVSSSGEDLLDKLCRLLSS